MGFKWHIFLLMVICYCQIAEWGYENNGAYKWPIMYPTCGDNLQSPVNINIFLAPTSPRLGRLRFTGYNTPAWLTVKNDGHTALVEVKSNAYIEGGGLHGRYKLTQFHFHWGSDNTRGSEHTINGVPARMEVHLVHYKESLGSFQSAQNFPGGLTVLGILYSGSMTNNGAYNDLVNKLSLVLPPGSTPVALQPQALLSLFPPLVGNYFRYTGSLTTPPCSQSVIWTVFQKTIPIANRQLQSFRQLFSSEKNVMFPVRLQNNYRPTQPLNRRIVESSSFLVF
ncbi:hypothetical protein LOTGIDRAFT_172731 [Lottia gigantea]|uniref:carbonic anhydrase n=1 Tax=Lottia gigantea TaxID=225164 RepID=V4AB29_LOTGI|nr:hypothetical protein LOTGIDRAFT_172731 [Lottia gigantea]ESP01204.1 hypothetical protein LOTGIDRAFT_172731 [Lottia gigantea]